MTKCRVFLFQPRQARTFQMHGLWKKPQPSHRLEDDSLTAGFGPGCMHTACEQAHVCLYACVCKFVIKCVSLCE